MTPDDPLFAFLGSETAFRALVVIAVFANVAVFVHFWVKR